MGQPLSAASLSEITAIAEEAYLFCPSHGGKLQNRVFPIRINLLLNLCDKRFVS